jgi:cell division protein FtsL
MPYQIDEAQEHLIKSEKRFRLFLVITTLVVAIFCAVQVVLVGRNVQRTNKEVQQQSQFIIYYLRCIGQTPQAERGPKASNDCIDTYQPGDIQ